MTRERLLVLAALLVLASPGPGADMPQRPNILLAIADDWSWPHAGVHGCKFVRTPAFDRVAASGVVFTRAFCASPGCSPSRAALLTGRNPWELAHAGTHASSFPRDLKVYPDALAAAGYHVGFTGKGWGPGNFKVTGWDHNPAGPGYDARVLKDVPKGIAKTDYAGNFRDFLAKRPKGKPFCFWYGGREPHRAYGKGNGLRAGKKLVDAEVPPFLPDTPEVRSDLLDYAVEVEWFDRHLGLMLEAIKEAGELENTLVVVASDNGMPFPRAKANAYEYGVHMPLAISWPARIRKGRTAEDLVSYIDLAPTFLEACRLKPLPEMTGKSLLPLLMEEKKRGTHRDRVFFARERHSSSRVHNLGYPCRGMRTEDFLYVRNFAPDRWPAGDPRGAGGATFGYYDIDASPTKTWMVEHQKDRGVSLLFDLAVGKRPADELYDARKDPGNLVNLAERAEYASVLKRLRGEMNEYLKKTGDPWAVGKGAVFESYRRYSPIRTFK
jgi:N-sulfoglucosamine sulfohydrolase